MEIQVRKEFGKRKENITLSNSKQLTKDQHGEAMKEREILLMQAL